MRRMTGEDFSHYDFSDSTIEGVEFVSADLTGASFENCVIKNVDFSHAILTGATFTNATLQGVVNFTRARIDGAEFNNLEFLEADEVIGAEFLLDADERGIGAHQKFEPVSPASAPVVRFLPDSAVVDARTTTDWGAVNADQEIGFGVPETSLAHDFVPVVRDIVNILLKDHEYFTISLRLADVTDPQTQHETTIELKFAITNEGNFRFDLDGLNNFTPELTSKKRILVKSVGWQGPELDERIPTYHRDFARGTPSRVFSEFLAQTVATFTSMGYFAIPGDIVPVYKHEQKPLNELISVWAGNNGLTKS